MQQRSSGAVLGRAHLFGGAQSERPGERGEPGEHGLLIGFKELVRPVDGRVERSVMGDVIASAGNEEF